MQDADLVERALIDYMRTSESSPTEDGDLEARASSMATGVASALAARAGAPKVVTPGNVAVVRVPMRAKGFRTTVTAGMDAFSQVVSPALSEMPRPLVGGAVDALRRLFPDAADRMESEVRERAARLTSDPEKVRAVQETIKARRERQFKLDRENLVSTMCDLLASGWTHQMLVDAVSVATCSNVLSA